MLQVQEFVGIYHADGGLRGEAAYVLGKFLGTAHCTLCDITHSPVRRKPSWDAMVSRLGVPFRLLHRNERDTEVLAATGDSPAVLVRVAGRVGLAPLLGRAEIEPILGSVPAFEGVLRGAVVQAGLVLPGSADPAHWR